MLSQSLTEFSPMRRTFYTQRDLKKMDQKPRNTGIKTLTTEGCGKRNFLLLLYFRIARLESHARIISIIFLVVK